MNKVNINSLYNGSSEFKARNSKTNIKDEEKLNQKYTEILENNKIINFDELKNLAWDGVPQSINK